jgi:hypothetical protein
MSADKYCIRHVEGTKAWVLKEWVPCNGDYKVIKTFGTDAAAIAHMRKIAEPSIEWTFYNKHGYEEIGDF